MLRLKINDITGSGAGERWASAGVRIPGYDAAEAARKGREKPVWAHFGAGNIFRGFTARLQDALLSKGFCDSGVSAIETFDFELIDKIYKPYDNLTLTAGLRADGKIDLDVSAGVAEAIRYDLDSRRAAEIFRAPTLQLASFTITEKGYAVPAADLDAGPEGAKAGGPLSAMGVTTALMWERFRSCRAPIALVSMDNYSRNGERLRESVMKVASAWASKGFVTEDFLRWLDDPSAVSYPWTMIDKITPRPSEKIREIIKERSIEDLPPVVTSRGTFIAPFVNAEIPQYLVVEDAFPAGRPPLEAAGVYFGDRDTVNKAERMKVTTCLNPLHTALAVFGCLLGYESIASEMGDAALRALVERIGRDEGLPVAPDPVIFKPADFLGEVLNERFPNPYIPDTPQRIATDTSQKMPIRFGETIKSYASAPNLDARSLIGVPLVIAAWFRYLLGVDDRLRPMKISDDPMLEKLQTALSGIEIGKPETVGDKLSPLLADETLFAVNLREVGLAEKVERYFRSMLAGEGAVRRTLEKVVLI